jgi:hypothetical protein
MRVRLPLCAATAVLVAFAASSSIATSAGSDWRTGDLFVSGSPAGARKQPQGAYFVMSADGTSTGEVVGVLRRAFTAGCAVDPATGHLWTANGLDNTVSRVDDLHDARGEHDVLASVNLRKATFVNGRAMGAVRAIGFDALGFVYAGTTDGTNRLLKLTRDGDLLATYPLEARGALWFDISADGRLLYYTSGDNVLRRYDLAAAQPLPPLATFLDGSIQGVRLLPGGQQILVAGSIYISRLDLSGQVIAQHWLPATSFSALNITPDGREFWTSTHFGGELYRMDIASGAVLQGPVATGALEVRGLCVKHEYTAAENVCRTLDAAGNSVEIACPAF